MMGAYIKGMEMPKSCACCDIACRYYLDHGLDGLLAKICRAESRLPDCPLVPVPPHGRLIDADAARGSIKPWSPEDERNACTFDTVKKLMHTMLDRAPIVIPADESDMDSFIRIFEEDDEEGMDSFIRILKD